MINRQEKRNWLFKRRVSSEARAAYEKKIEEEYPGYFWESKKHEAIVWTLTGVRALYAIFYLIMTQLMGLNAGGQIFILIQLVLFYFWASLMIRYGGFVAVFLLVVRGLDIIRSGPALLAISPYVTPIWIFVLVLALVIEFIEAVFCIYLLFNRQAAQTIKLRRMMYRELPDLEKSVDREMVETMAGYRNPSDDSSGTGEESQTKTREQAKEQEEPEKPKESEQPAEPEKLKESEKLAEPEKLKESEKLAEPERKEAESEDGNDSTPS